MKRGGPKSGKKSGPAGKEYNPPFKVYAYESLLYMKKDIDSWKKNLPKSLEVLSEGYNARLLSSDFFAGLTVAVVALPLAMAFAIASGVAPEKGLFTAIVAGLLISMLGGSRYQIGGPTGAFVVIVYGVVTEHGYEGLALATIMAGVMLILLGLFRFGAVIKFIPYPVTTGFTAGIALIIFSSQIKDFAGLPIMSVPPGFIDQWTAYAGSAFGLNWVALGLSAVSVVLLFVLRNRAPKIPGPVVVVFLGAVGAAVFDLPVETIESRFGGIPNFLPTPSLPEITLEKLRAVAPDAVTIALLGAIESLMSAVVADGMTGDRSRSNTELVAQGAANMASVAFGGIPATGAIARTATNIKSGAKTPVSGMIHAALLLVFMFFLAPLIVKIPLASLSAVLVVVAWNMSDAKRFVSLLRAPKNDVLVLVITFLLTVFVGLNEAVQVGVVLAAFLFIKRMVEVTEITEVKDGYVSLLAGDSRPDEDPDAITNKITPEGVEVYEINGPFFFGVAERLKTALGVIQKPPKVFVLRMRYVPTIDATAMAALEEFYARSRARGTQLVLSGVNERLRAKLERYGFVDQIGAENVLGHIDDALERAGAIVKAGEAG